MPKPDNDGSTFVGSVEMEKEAADRFGAEAKLKGFRKNYADITFDEVDKYHQGQKVLI